MILHRLIVPGIKLTDRQWRLVGAMSQALLVVLRLK